MTARLIFRSLYFPLPRFQNKRRQSLGAEYLKSYFNQHFSRMAFSLKIATANAWVTQTAKRISTSHWRDKVLIGFNVDFLGAKCEFMSLRFTSCLYK